MRSAPPSLHAYREALAAIRRAESRERTGRNAEATAGYLRALYLEAERARQGLRVSASGWAWAEHQLAQRVSAARRAGQKRPELTERLAAARREVRAMLAEERGAC
jgi:hypothetical protein